jgi:hypothetical protein
VCTRVCVCKWVRKRHTHAKKAAGTAGCRHTQMVGTEQRRCVCVGGRSAGLLLPPPGFLLPVAAKGGEGAKQKAGGRTICPRVPFFFKMVCQRKSGGRGTKLRVCVDKKPRKKTFEGEEKGEYRV